MTLFFNLEALEKAGTNSIELIKLLELHYKKKLSLVKPKLKLAGYSFILNPKDLFAAKKGIDPNFIIQYIKLAGRRDYALYKLYKETGLPRSFYPDLNLEAIKTNPLLIITKDKINFLYEDKKENTWQ